MTLCSIVNVGNPNLKMRSEEVAWDQIKTHEIQSIIDNLLLTMQYHHGAGLAAPQIGTNLRIVTYGFDVNPRYPEAEPVALTMMINPIILTHSHEMQPGFEGCLSLGTLRGEVPRYTELQVKFYDRKGNEIVKAVKGFEARIIQHEIDHLDGKFFIERMSSFEHFGFTEELKIHGIIP